MHLNYRFSDGIPPRVTPGPPYSNVTFDPGIIDGDVKTWVEKLEKFRRDVRHLPA
jgi:hypothetical protein